MPRVLLDVTSLVSGGVVQALQKGVAPGRAADEVRSPVVG